MIINKITNYLDNIEKNKLINKYLGYGVKAIKTFINKPIINTTNSPFIRDYTDLKRFMFMVVIALLPCLIFGIYNVGRNSYLSIKYYNFSFLEAFLEGSIHVIPLIIISYIVGGICELIFAQIRKHEISEGFLVTGMLYPLICPPTIPWWIFSIGIIFGVVIGKEIFGGVGQNILNPALTARTFVFFAYPAFISGDIWSVIPIKKLENGTLIPSNWTFIDKDKIINFIENSNNTIDNLSSQTILSVTKAMQENTDFSINTIREIYPIKNLIIGLIPGSIGETSIILCLIGALFLIITKIASWRIIIGVFLGGFLTSYFFNFFFNNNYDSIFSLTALEHLIIGGFCFGAIFMATDPVTAPLCKESKFIYGLLIGFLCIIIRLFNPAFPEGMMLSILFMNIFSPLIDNIIINKKKGINI